jgi:O-antigen/teichoic acid export membrane protein
VYYLGGYFAPGPTITKKTYWKLVGFLLAATINAILNYVLIPIMGILGAAVATTTASLAAGIFNQVVSNRLFFLPNRWKSSFALIILFTAAISCMQNEVFPYNINKIHFLTRILFTVILMCGATLPFYRDMKASGISSQMVKMIRDRVY